MRCSDISVLKCSTKPYHTYYKYQEPYQGYWKILIALIWWMVYSQNSHLHFLKSCSTKILSTSFGKICFSKILIESVWRMKIIIPTPFLLLSNLYDLEKPSIKNRDSKKDSSNFASVTRKSCTNLLRQSVMMMLAKGWLLLMTFWKWG